MAKRRKRIRRKRKAYRPKLRVRKPPKKKRKPKKSPVARFFPILAAVLYEPPEYEPPDPDVEDNLGVHLEQGKWVTPEQRGAASFASRTWYFQGHDAEAQVYALLEWIAKHHSECRVNVAMGTGFSPDSQVPPHLSHGILNNKKDVDWVGTPFDLPKNARTAWENLQYKLQEQYSDIYDAQGEEIAWFRVEMLCPVRRVTASG